MDIGTPLDEKAKRMKDLLTSFYSSDQASPSIKNSKLSSLDFIDSVSFDSDLYMDLLVQQSSLEGLLQKHIEMSAEIKNLDTDLQMLVYENYNKFICATDTIKRMKSNIVGMETNMGQLLGKIMTVQSRSDGVNTSLFEKREHIEKLHQTRNLLRKVQFIYDLPSRLGKCIKSEAYADAVKFYTGSMPIFKIYGDSSFQDCKRASEDAMTVVVKKLQEKLFSDCESIQARAEAAVLLKKLNFPVETLKTQLFEKLEQSLSELQINFGDFSGYSDKYHDIVGTGDNSNLENATTDNNSIKEFKEAVRAYRVIFPESEYQLLKLTKELMRRHFEITNLYIKKQISVSNLRKVLAIIWRDVLFLEEVMPEALLPDYSLEATKDVVKQYVSNAFVTLSQKIIGVIISFNTSHNKDWKDPTLSAARDTVQNALLQASVDLLLEVNQLITDHSGLLEKLHDLTIDWVQEGFHDFFRSLNSRFFMLSGRNKPGTQEISLSEDMNNDKLPASLVLVLSQVSLFIERTVIPRITEEMAMSLSGGGTRGFDSGPAFVPGEICRIFRFAGDKLLSQYINIRSQKVSILLRKRLSTPNWIKHKEPREVHMFVDLFLQELEETRNEVMQIFPGGPMRKHQRSESNGSSTSSRNNPLKDDKVTRSNTNKGRSQLLETHLAKLFKQKVKIFTKVEHTQESVISMVVKLCLKSLQEFVRLHTFNRSGFQQIQLDIQFLRSPLNNIVADEDAVDFLLDEIIVGASERCHDPIPLEPPILEKLIHAKLAKANEQTTTLS